MDASDALRTFLAAMTPIGELRLAIPLGILTLKIAWYQALLISLVGNIIPVLVLVPGLEHVARLLRRFPKPISGLLEWRAQRLRVAQSARFNKYGAAALVLFVGIPLPFTGAWTGSLLAWAFQVPIGRAIPLIALGVLIAGGIVTALTVSGLQVSLFLADR